MAKMNTWATPTTMDTLPPKSEAALEREFLIMRPGRSKPANLRDQISNMDNWPPPKKQNANSPGIHGQGGLDLQTAVSMWPTPRAGKTSDETEESWTARNEARKVATPPLTLAVKMFPTPTKENGLRNDSQSEHFPHCWQHPGHPEYGQLNPDWVEWLMGWPVGWTLLEPLPASAFSDWQAAISNAAWWLAEPENVPRVTQIKINRVSRLQAIGNGQVPLTAAIAFIILSQGLAQE